MKTRLFLSSTFLVFNGILLMGLGLYFVFIRSPLLPEDPRFIGTTLAEIQATMPGLLIWLRRVFWVTLASGAHLPWYGLSRTVPGSAGVGGFMFTAGVLTTYVAATAFQQLTRSVRFVIALAALTSIGWMAVINFMIDSNFKWLLLAFNLPWIVALVVSWREDRPA